MPRGGLEVTESNLDEITDFAGYRQAFLEMHGFAVEGTNYDEEVEPAVDIELAAGG